MPHCGNIHKFSVRVDVVSFLTSGRRKDCPSSCHSSPKSYFSGRELGKDLMGTVLEVTYI